MTPAYPRRQPAQQGIARALIVGVSAARFDTVTPDPTRLIARDVAWPGCPGRRLVPHPPHPRTAAHTRILPQGIQDAHLIRDDQQAQLCLHYDPELLPLSRIRRLAEEAGVAISDRYRHEQIPLVGLDAADNAQHVADAVAHVTGVLHASANYADGTLAVAYDATLTTREAIERRMRRMGARTPAQPRADADDHDDHAGHGSAPAFLLHWLQERWTLVLVGMAGLALLIGWVGESFLSMPAGVAIGFYLLAYLAGGYDIATPQFRACSVVSSTPMC